MHRRGRVITLIIIYIPYYLRVHKMTMRRAFASGVPAISHTGLVFISSVTLFPENIARINRDVSWVFTRERSLRVIILYLRRTFFYIAFISGVLTSYPRRRYATFVSIVFISRHRRSLRAHASITRALQRPLFTSWVPGKRGK